MLKLIIFISLLLFSCKDNGNPVSLNQNSSTYSDVQTILYSNCYQCHDSTTSLGDLNLSTYENIINSGSIVSGDALNSNLIDRITRFEGDGLLMPPPNRLSQDDIDIIIEWINNGALE